MTAATETSALLPKANEHDTSICQSRSGRLIYGTTEATDDALVRSSQIVQTTWKAETKILARYSAPLIITYVLQYSYMFVTVIVSGKLGTNELAAASLASMTANVTGLAIYEGLATSLDTLTSQAFGAGKKQLVGLQIQRMIALSLLATVPIGAVWLCSPWILVRLVPERDVALLAGDFLRFYLIAAPGYGIFEAVKRFTQCQGDFMGPLVTTLICAPLNIFWNWLIVFKLGLGFRGAAIAVGITNTSQPLIFVLYIRFLAPEALQCWSGFEIRRAFTNWGPMVKLAIPGVVMVLSEWLAFDILTFACSYVSTTALAAQSVVMTVAVAMYHIPFPTSIAAGTRFGNLIGLGDLFAAKVAFNTHYCIFILIGLFDVVLLTSCREVIAMAFTHDERVRAAIIAVLPIVAAAQLFDALLAISNGLIRGMGRQKFAAIVNFLVYYVFALPLSMLLTFGPPRLGLIGLWIGPLNGLGLTALLLYLYMRFSDWEKAVNEARTRDD